MAGPRDDDELNQDRAKHPGRVVDLATYRIRRTMNRLKSGRPVTLVQNQDKPADVVDIEVLRKHRDSKISDELMGGGKGIPRPELNTCTTCGDKTPFKGKCLDCQQEGK